MTNRRAWDGRNERGWEGVLNCGCITLTNSNVAFSSDGASQAKRERTSRRRAWCWRRRARAGILRAAVAPLARPPTFNVERQVLAQSMRFALVLAQGRGTPVGPRIVWLVDGATGRCVSILLATSLLPPSPPSFRLKKITFPSSTPGGEWCDGPKGRGQGDGCLLHAADMVHQCARY